MLWLAENLTSISPDQGLPARCARCPHWAAGHAVTAMQTLLADTTGSQWPRLTMVASGGCSHQSCSANMGGHTEIVVGSTACIKAAVQTWALTRRPAVPH